MNRINRINRINRNWNDFFRVSQPAFCTPLPQLQVDAYSEPQTGLSEQKCQLAMYASFSVVVGVAFRFSRRSSSAKVLLHHGRMLLARAVLDGGCVNFGANGGHLFFIGAAQWAWGYPGMLPLSDATSGKPAWTPGHGAALGRCAEGWPRNQPRTAHLAMRGFASRLAIELDQFARVKRGKIIAILRKKLLQKNSDPTYMSPARTDLIYAYSQSQPKHVFGSCGTN